MSAGFDLWMCPGCKVILGKRIRCPVCHTDITDEHRFGVKEW